MKNFGKQNEANAKLKISLAETRISVMKYLKSSYNSACWSVQFGFLTEVSLTNYYNNFFNFNSVIVSTHSRDKRF